jgi:hypothetical protein
VYVEARIFRLRAFNQRQEEKIKMRQNQTVKKQIFGLMHVFLCFAAVFAGTIAAQDDRVSLAGVWNGSFQTPGPAGSLEIALTEAENKWSGEVKIEGPGNKILTKPARNIKVEGDKLAFMIELMGAEVTFTGKLADGKLTGGLEALQDGKTVGMGSWEMRRAKQ